VDALKTLFSPAISALGCRLWGIELMNPGRQPLLRVFIDRADGVTIEDCEAVSRRLGALMDVEDMIAGKYTLEVSSPGMDRRLFELSQYEESVGEQVSVRLEQPFEGRRKLVGVLQAVEGDEIVLRVEDDEYVLPFEWIAKGHIVPTFA
jgi:ribosome maturation factor RimP